MDDHLEERSGPNGLVKRREEPTDHQQAVRQVVFALDQYVADGAQLFEDVVEVGVVVDQALYLCGEGGDVAQQGVDGATAVVEGGQQRLGVDQQPVHLRAAISQHAGHLVGLGQQVLDLLVALADGVGELGHAIEGGLSCG